MTREEHEYVYVWLNRAQITEDMLQECAALFSSHYGVWGERSGRHERRITLSASRMHDFLPNECWSILARHKERLVGYAFGIRTDVPDFGVVNWVTQLVVHGDHRNRGISKHLLFTFFGFSDHAAWGLVTSNPYAVRALEDITRRRCSIDVIQGHAGILREAGGHISYTRNRPICFTNRSAIDTDFHISHRHLRAKLEAVTSEAKPWTLGSIREGEEWLAFTFKEQPRIPLTPEETTTMLARSEQTVRTAYERMKTGPMQAWMKFGDAEADFAARELGLVAGNRVLDLGCGRGRHAVALAEKGFDVVGVDFLPSLIDVAKADAERRGLTNVKFFCEDGRTTDLGSGTFHGAVCLYDVVGTFPEAEENQKVLANLVNHLVPGGRALVSVLNMELTAHIAIHRASVARDPDALLRLQPGDVMQNSGQIFDPNLFLLDSETGVVYRKEQFDGDNKPPGELIVRDRRYTRTNVHEMTARAGARVVWARPVALGNWDSELEGTDIRAKEILFLIERV